jgi:hypothetical protein
MPLPRIGSELAVDVELRKALRQFVQRDRFGLQSRRQRRATLERAVGNGDRSRLPCGEVRRAQIDHLARADQQHALLGDRRKDALGEPDRGGGHRNRCAADVGMRAHVLGDGKRALEQAVEHQPQRSRRRGSLHRLLHLAQDLRLTQDHRIESARDAERVRNGPFLRQRVDVLRQRRPGHAMERLEPLHDRLGLGAMEVNLGPIAGRQNRRLLDLRLPEEIAQCGAQRIDLERDPLPHLERRGAVVKAECVERHGRDRPKLVILPQRVATT